MQLDERDQAYLWDMLEAAKEITAFLKGIRYDDFVRSKMIRSAVECQLMIVGEAAKRVSEEFQEKHPEIPWRQIIGQRNVLAHEYGDIKVERVWAAATINVLALLKALESLVLEE